MLSSTLFNSSSTFSSPPMLRMMGRVFLVSLSVVAVAVAVIVVAVFVAVPVVSSSVLHFVVSASGLPSTSVTSTMGPSGSKESSSSTPLSIAATASS